MDIYSKTKKVLRKTEWALLGTRRNDLEGWLDEVIDKSFYQKVADPAKLMKYSAIEIWYRITFWYFIFFVILIIMLVILVGFFTYLSDTGQAIETSLRLYAPIITYILAILFTYFLFAFRMPSATRQSLVSKDSIKKVVSILQNEIISEKEADLLDKNISDLAKSSKRRKILIRIITVAAITYVFKETEGLSVWISTGATILVALLFELYALGSRAIFANAKYAVREIALRHSNAKSDENENI